MLNIPSTQVLSIAAALAFAATAAVAEDTTRSSTSPAPATTTIGVTPQDAQEAMKKASPNADTGTLVRTEPSVDKRARTQARDAKNNTHPGNANTTPRPAGVPRNKTTGTVTNTTTPNAAMGITGTVPGADNTSGDATNTRDNADKGKSGASGTADTTQPMDTMGNRRSSTPSKP